jgi:hypothetical protein
MQVIPAYAHPLCDQQTSRIAVIDLDMARICRFPSERLCSMAQASVAHKPR